MADYWMKMHVDVINSRDFARLSDSAWRTYFEICLLTKSTTNDGSLGDESDIAWFLRKSEDQVLDALTELEENGFVTRTDTGWFIDDYESSQAKMEAGERMKRKREKDRTNAVTAKLQGNSEDVTEENEGRYEDVTARNTEKRREEKELRGELRGEKEKEFPRARANALAPAPVSLSRKQDERTNGGGEESDFREAETETIRGDRYVNPFGEKGAKRREKQFALSVDCLQNEQTNDLNAARGGDAAAKSEAGNPGRGKRFRPPTVEEVRAYCEERQNSVDAEKFVDFYASKGWMVGSNRMKDWQASVRTWERKDSDFRNSANRGPSGSGTATSSGKSTNSSNERRKTLVELYDEREAAKRAEAEANAKIIDGTFTDARSEPVYGGLQTAGGGGRWTAGT